MPWWNADEIRKELNELRKTYTDAGHQLADRLTEGLTQLHRDNSDIRRQLLEAVNNGLGALRTENLALRARLDSIADDVAAIRRSVETRHPAPTEALLPATAPAATEQDGQPKTVQLDDYERHSGLLLTAAHISSATMDCHRDTWAFIVQQTARHPHFHVPGEATDIGRGKVRVALSGPSLVAILITLREAAQAHQSDSPTSDSGTWAMAASLYTGLSATIGIVQNSSQVDPEALRDVTLTIDDRFGPRRPAPESDEDDDGKP